MALQHPTKPAQAQAHGIGKGEENPPEYAEISRQNVHPTVGYAVAYTANAVTLPEATNTQLHFFTKREDIQGTFYVDPSAPRLSKPSKKQLSDFQASFRSRKGKIAIDVGTTGRGAKASALISSRKGAVHVNILPLLPNRPRISLDVSSRKGNVVLFIPDSYYGILRLDTKKGKLEFLPSLSGAMQTFKMAPKEALVYFGTSQGSPDQSGDFCQITTRDGSITVGIAGRDKYPGEPGPMAAVGKCYSSIHQIE